MQRSWPKGEKDRKGKREKGGNARGQKEGGMEDRKRSRARSTESTRAGEEKRNSGQRRKTLDTVVDHVE